MLVAEGKRKIRWRWGAIAALAMMLLAVYPQAHFWIIRGSHWNGFYAAMEGVGDEVAYSAYVNALIDGRPRRNDPYTGRDDQKQDPRPESLFSIQFVPAYMIAIPARAFQLSAATAFILLMPLAAGAASLAIFYLITCVTGDERWAASGVIVILCLGTLVGGHGHIVSLFGYDPLYNYLIFLRRYQPSATFALFFVFCGLVWNSLTSERKLRSSIESAVAGLVFSLLVFSYVYLWTAAAAWLVCVAMLWLVARPADWRRVVRSFCLIAGMFALALIPFALFYSKRSLTLDSVQAVEISHRPDLFRLPELIAFALIAVLTVSAIRRVISIRDKAILFSVSFALMTIAVFNQQIITGRSLQPLHYEMFVANYSILIAVVIAFARFRKTQGGPASRLQKRTLMWIAIAAFEWGGYETFVATKGSMSFAGKLDDSRPVAIRLAELAGGEERNATGETVLCTDLLAADGLPTSAPQPVLWAPHMLVFSGATIAESKERFYQYLYYTGIDRERLRKILTTEGRYGFAVALFGFERTIKGLSVNPRPITSEELEGELGRYAEYSQSFNWKRAAGTPLSYLLVPRDDEPDLSNLDRWYRRDTGEGIGSFTLYRVRLRDQVSHLAK
jgi:hypothetical protein